MGPGGRSRIAPGAARRAGPGRSASTRTDRARRGRRRRRAERGRQPLLRRPRGGTGRRRGRPLDPSRGRAGLRAGAVQPRPAPLPEPRGDRHRRRGRPLVRGGGRAGLPARPGGARLPAHLRRGGGGEPRARVHVAGARPPRRAGTTSRGGSTPSAATSWPSAWPPGRSTRAAGWRMRGGRTTVPRLRVAERWPPGRRPPVEDPGRRSCSPAHSSIIRERSIDCTKRPRRSSAGSTRAPNSPRMRSRMAASDVRPSHAFQTNAPTSSSRIR